MKVLHIYKSYYPYTVGGIEKCIESLCLNALNFGVESEVATVAPCEDIIEKKINGVNVTYYPVSFEKFSCPFSLSLLKNIQKKSNEFDLVHFHFPWPFADLLVLFQQIKKPYVITYHSDIIRQKIVMPLYSPFLYYFLSHAKKIVATSENYKKSSPVLKRFSKKVEVISIGLNDAAQEESFFSIQYPKPYFLFLGVLREYKGLHFLIDAMCGAQNYHLIIAGNGPCFSKLQKKVKDLGLNNVLLTGKVNDEQKNALFSNAFAVVSSAHLRSEAYCYMLVEGLMYGKPLISTELQTGTSFVNLDGETGIVVPSSDSVALRLAMDRLSTDKTLYEQYALATRARFLRYFTSQEMAELYNILYQKCVCISREG